MTLSIIKAGNTWHYESDLPHGTPTSVTHEIHVPDQIIPSSMKGAQHYRLQPHPMNLIDRPITASELLELAHLRISSEIYIVTTII